MANEFTRITHAVSGGSEATNLNPSNVADTTVAAAYSIYTEAGASDVGQNKIPVFGYAKVKIRFHPSYYASMQYCFQMSDGTYTTPAAGSSGWSDFITVPDGAIGLRIINNANANNTVFYSLYNS